MALKTKTIGFVGLGLIGGSIAKAILKIYPNTRILATASRESTIEAAFEERLIDNNGKLKIHQFGQCDIIFLCSPVKVNCDYLRQLKDVVKPDCIITDVGSVKGDITAVARELGITNQFIGGHPMTGSELTGLEHSSAHLLENAYYILTADSDMSKQTYDDFSSYIESIGAIPIKLSPEEHDEATATVSHLPHVVAAALVNLVQDTDDERAIKKTIAAGGFKDITRIASGSPTMWQHIFLSNKDAVLKLIDDYQAELNKFRDAIADANADDILSLWTKAKDYRDSITIPGNALIRIYELYCDIDDRPGTLVGVLQLLANADISVKNIDIIHNREFEPGVLRIEFYTDEAMKKAQTVLTHNNYYVRQRTN
ncbi:prephenate dehydrogenase [Pseudobutyrivibrio xylanivorans]|uniref:Prephenate dehydrogenase n=1 Tax=Pseudobutyrivibrio xylanivorans TaxID=185007 RepID=A0A5P6VVP8_PSEXY|nr:prephenate dehydrogenase [Pseudobutyrivibrio xylanivorans]QFJ55684.1 prephenate dehydrogenase [Pseudobutyrivibrio xylanivorans]